MKMSHTYLWAAVAVVFVLACGMPSQGQTATEHADTPDAAHAEGAHEHGAGEDAGQDQESEGHDHATDHGSPEKRSGFIHLMGKFHPLMVHFPIALLLAATLSEMVTVAKKGAAVSETTLYCLGLGALSAVAAASLGWANALGATYDATIGSVALLTLHRWVGTTTALLAIATLTLAVRARRQSEGSARGYRAALIATSLFVGVSGHLGALLVYGLDYFSQ
jgi:uncharacterized membrane protein